jgi:predicted lipoprotein with Yx(FWY)xxD motif
VAGHGVDPRLLGSVYRADLGTFQVTYADHPLYLFDPGPMSFIGQHWFETVLPISPDRGLWSLISPSGLSAPGTAQLEPETPLAGQTTYTSPKVGAQVFPNAGVLGPPFPVGGFTASVYAFSGDSPWQSRCVGACTSIWIPVLTSARPTVTSGLSAHDVGVIDRTDGSHQVTYDGHPLYLYGLEAVLFDASHNPISTGTTGNGDGVHAFGGTFSLVNP